MKILLIRLRLIGDVVFTTPAVAALRRRFPDAHISYLVEPAAEPVVRHNPHLDEVIVAERPRGLRRLAYDLRLARRLRRAASIWSIDFHGGPRSAWLTRATGASRRIGYDVPGRAWAYTNALPWTRSLRAAAPFGAEPVGPAGAAGHSRCPSRRRPPVEMPEDPAAAARGADAAAPPRASTDDAPIVVMHVSAGNPFRRWPAEHFATRGGGAGARGSRDGGLSSPLARRSAAPPTRSRRRRSRALAGGRGSHRALRRVRLVRAAGAGGARGAVHRRRQRTAAHRGDDQRPDRRAVRTDAAGAVDAVARRRVRARSRSTPGRCPAGRAISGTACRAISGA